MIKMFWESDKDRFFVVDRQSNRWIGMVRSDGQQWVSEGVVSIHGFKDFLSAGKDLLGFNGVGR